MCRRADAGFWDHEWQRHGTCARPITGDRPSFFQAVMRLHEKYDLDVSPPPTPPPPHTHGVAAAGWQGVMKLAQQALGACVGSTPIPKCPGWRQRRRQRAPNPARPPRPALPACPPGPQVALSEAGIEPSSAQTYTSARLSRAVEDAFGVRPMVSCFKGQLLELWLCVGLDLKVGLGLPGRRLSICDRW